MVTRKSNSKTNKIFRKTRKKRGAFIIFNPTTVKYILPI